jgi:hypothetical protein
LRERKAAGYLDRLLRQRESDAAAPPKRLSWPVTKITREPGNALTTAASGNWAAPRSVSGRAVASDRPAGAAPPTARSGDHDPHRTAKRGPHTVLEPGHGTPSAMPESGHGDPAAIPAATRSSHTVLEPSDSGPPIVPEPGHGDPAAEPALEQQWPSVAPVRVTASRARPAEARPADVSAAARPHPAGEPTRSTPAHDNDQVSSPAPEGRWRGAGSPGQGAALPQTQRASPTAGTPAARNGLTEVKPSTAGPFAGRLLSAARPGTASDQAARIEIGVLEVRVSAPPPAVPPSATAASDPVPAAPRPERLSRGSYPFGLRQG